MTNEIPISPKGKLKRKTQEGKIYMNELDELESLIKDDRTHSKAFYASGLFVSLTGAPVLNILKNTPLELTSMMKMLSESGSFYIISFFIFIISLICLIIFWWESKRDKGRAIAKISLIKREHGYES